MPVCCNIVESQPRIAKNREKHHDINIDPDRQNCTVTILAKKNMNDLSNSRSTAEPLWNVTFKSHAKQQRVTDSQQIVGIVSKVK